MLPLINIWLKNMKVDAKGLLCPEPIMMLHKAMKELKSGEKVELYATDPSTERDIDRFCKFLGHNLLNKETSTEPFYFLIEKQGSKN